MDADVGRYASSKKLIAYSHYSLITFKSGSREYGENQPFTQRLSLTHEQCGCCSCSFSYSLVQVQQIVNDLTASASPAINTVCKQWYL